MGDNEGAFNNFNGPMYYNIQLLRGIAACMVVLFHVVLWLPQPAAGAEPVIYQIFHSWGKSGVDLFFVISGFVIMTSQMRKPRPVGTFLRDRALRILPLYWLVTLVFAALLLALPQLAGNQPDLTPARLLQSLGMVHFLLTGQFPVVFVGWTLEYEALFYLLFAIGMAFLPLRYLPLALGAVLAAIYLAGGVEARVIQFAMGMMIAQLRLRTDHLPFAWPLLLAGLAVFLGSIRWPNDDLRLLLWGIPSVMIVTALVFLPQIRNRLANYLGNASYAIYLVQPLAIPVGVKLTAALAGHAGFTAQALLVSSMAVIGGCLTHSFVEKPMNALLRRPRRVPAPAGVAP
ncbi:acyltransferase family protein [Paracoccus sp. DK608]|uniref:Acyltransferase family protein n=2 Tax=Paracoccus shanxieyensis TaxID=2675752 RepID=A0A6L6IXL1_9RHOB|nr:acyltransferase family protein [Paracoccus shanxieyensis]MTH88431.1 acyltransferase family protein [Paracoccus shanxieyensis]